MYLSVPNVPKLTETYKMYQVYQMHKMYKMYKMYANVVKCTKCTKCTNCFPFTLCTKCSIFKIQYPNELRNLKRRSNEKCQKTGTQQFERTVPNVTKCNQMYKK